MGLHIIFIWNILWEAYEMPDTAFLDKLPYLPIKHCSKRLPSTKTRERQNLKHQKHDQASLVFHGAFLDHNEL